MIDRKRSAPHITTTLCSVSSLSAEIEERR